MKKSNKKRNITKKPQATRFSHRDGGFTVIELMVTVAIFVIIYSIVLVKNSEFNSSVRLTNLAYEIALQIREAQTFGVSVKEFGTGPSSTFDLGYGVYFDESLPTSFLLFADTDKNIQRKTDGTEDIDQLNIEGGNRINKFCATPKSSPEVCSDTGILDWLTVVFIRPIPDANIRTSAAIGYESARIEVSSQGGATRTVNIESTGQISIEK